MSVYFITCRELGLVKIGHAKDPRRRFQGFQTSTPQELALEAEFEGAAAEERELHERFAEHRQRGEWFKLCPEIEALIVKHKPPVPTQMAFEQDELVGPFRFDPKGWLAMHGQLPREEWPYGVTEWLQRHPEEVA